MDPDESNKKMPTIRGQVALNFEALSPILRIQPEQVRVLLEIPKFARFDLEKMGSIDASAALKQMDGILGRAAQEFTKFMTPLAQAIPTWLSAQTPFMEALEKFSKRNEELPKSTKIAAIRVARLGWHLGPYCNGDCDLWIEKMETVQEIDSYFIEMYRPSLDLMEQNLTRRNPRRSTILSAGFAAHRDKTFALSVPIFLAQSEGIARENGFDKLFTSSANAANHRKAKLDEAMVQPYVDALLEPLRTPLATGITIDNWSGEPLSPNRHAILHGIDTEYATETNSWKALSLLSYIGWVLPILNRDDQEDPSDEQ